MKNFKKHFLYGLAAFALLAAPVQGFAEKGVVLVKADGSQLEHALGDVDHIAIGSQSVTLHHSSGDTHEVAFGDLDRILIGAEVTAIKSIMNDGDLAVWPTRTAGPVNATGLKAGAAVEVYGTDGQLVASAKADSDGTATLDISSAAPGIYIVAVQGNSVKIVKN